MLARTALAGLVVLLGTAGATRAQEPKKEAPKPQAPRIPPGVKAERDVEYGKAGEISLKLDLYLPEDSPSAPLPVVVWVHGGGWSGGSKNGGPAVPLAARGYAVASVEYRLTGVAPFPAQIEDCRAAVRWLRANASKYHLDPDRVGAWGASAGGHLVALLGTAGAHLVALLGTAGDEKKWDIGTNLDQSSRVQAVCDYFGPADFSLYPTTGPVARSESVIGRLLGGPLAEKQEEARQASPVTHVSKDDPPFLILHGDQDRSVRIVHSERLQDALKKAGVDSTLITVKNGGHGFGPESDPNPAEVREMVFEFFDKHLKAKKRPSE